MADNTSSRSDDSLSVEDKSCIEQSKMLLNQSSEKAEENLGTKTSTKKASFKKHRSRTIQAFVASAGIVMCAQLALTTYSKSILTSIEKYFGISSSLAGFIVGSFNIGNLLLVVAVSNSLNINASILNDRTAKSKFFGRSYLITLEIEIFL